MRTKDFLMLEAAYQAVLEAKDTPPCPCTVGKKCKKPKCPCTKCKKDKAKMMKEMSDEDMADGMLYSPEDQDAQPAEQDPLDDPVIQSALSIIQQYAQGDLTNLQAAMKIQKLIENGGDHGPTQDDMYYTTNQP